MNKEQLEQLKTADEKELRELKIDFPKSIEEVNQIIEAVTDRNHDYGTCVYAMSIAAISAMNYVAHVLGVTGFQASCADLDIVRRSRLLDCPFTIIKADDLLFPQYDIRQQVEETISGWQGWASEKAAEKLTKQNEGDYPAHPDVIAHWEKLASREMNV